MFRFLPVPMVAVRAPACPALDLADLVLQICLDLRAVAGRVLEHFAFQIDHFLFKRVGECGKGVIVDLKFADSGI